MPSVTRRTRPCASSSDSTQPAVSLGTAKPMPCAAAMIAVFTPTTRAAESSNGPPELPGFSGAVCWMTLSISRPLRARKPRPIALMTPADTVDWKPSGLPIAIASWPGRSDFGIADLDERQRRCVGSQHREVGRRVAADDARFDASTVAQRDHRALADVLGDVVVRQQVAVGRDEEAGALTARFAAGPSASTETTASSTASTTPTTACEYASSRLVSSRDGVRAARFGVAFDSVQPTDVAHGIPFGAHEARSRAVRA